MTRGRKPKPAALHGLHGNPGHRAPKADGPDLPRRAPACPKHLGPEGRAEYRRICRLLKGRGVLAETDRAVLTAYAEAWQAYVRASAEVARDGPELTSTTTGQTYTSPAYHRMTGAAKTMVRLAAELGLTPTARARLKVEPEAEAGDPLLDLLRRRQSSSN